MGKKIFLKDIEDGQQFNTSLLVMKRLYKDTNKVVYLLSDKSEQIKAKIPSRIKLEIGDVISINTQKTFILDISQIEKLTDYNLEDYLPTVNRSIDDIINEIEIISEECITSQEGKLLNDYFFKDQDFISKFKIAIGGISMHHNYIGGLCEHTLGVMYLTKVLCDRYNCRRREIAVLSAKLHDIGKIYELDYNGPFKYTLQGELEGHIAIGVQLIDRAFNNIDYPFSDDFIRRIKGCIIQHHGKIEYGSPREANMEESFILNYADSVDATLNRINQIKEVTKENSWSEYDRRIDKKLYL